MRSIVMDRIIWTRLLFPYGLFVLYGDMEGKLKRHQFYSHCSNIRGNGPVIMYIVSRQNLTTIVYTRMLLLLDVFITHIVNQ